MNTCPKCSCPLRIRQYLRFTISACVNPECYDHLHVEHLECCTNPDMQLVRYIVANGTPHVRNQCRTCGRLHTKSIGGYTPEQKKTFPLVDEAAREKADNYWQEVSEIRTRYVQKSQSLRREAWMDRYTDYLQSEEWRMKRETVLIRDKHLCQSCLINKATQVHHRSYEFVDFSGMEPCFDLVAICIPCHEKLHAVRNQRKSA